MKIKVTLSFDYEVDEKSEKALAAYGSNNPDEIIAVDRQQFEEDPFLVGETADNMSTTTITVEQIR